MKLTKDLLFEMVKREVNESRKQRGAAERSRPKAETAETLIVAGVVYPIERKMVDMGDYEAMKLHIVKDGQKLEIFPQGQQNNIARFARNEKGEKVNLLPDSAGDLSRSSYEQLVSLK